MFKKLGTRQRIVISSILITIFSFLLISPFIKVIGEYFQAPSQISNLEVVKTSLGEITLRWDRGGEYDLAGYKILKDSEEFIVGNNVDNYTVRGLDQLRNYAFSIASFDNSNKVSSPLQFRYSDLESNRIFLNSSTDQPFIVSLLIKSIILGVLIFLLTAWSLFYKFNRKTLLNIVMLPSFLLIPYLLLSITTIEAINLYTNKLLISVLLSSVFFIVGYISLLAVNILNAASVSRLPLEQAGKATQFILSLISTYLILIYAFASYQNILFRLMLLVPFVFIYTYTGLSINKNTNYFALVKSLGITLMIVVASIVASVWPVEVAYSILMIAITYYIMLNLALELRTRYTGAMWVEYITLILLITLLFFTTSAWGINFSIL